MSQRDKTTTNKKFQNSSVYTLLIKPCCAVYCRLCRKNEFPIPVTIYILTHLQTKLLRLTASLEINELGEWVAPCNKYLCNPCLAYLHLFCLWAPLFLNRLMELKASLRKSNQHETTFCLGNKIVSVNFINTSNVDNFFDNLKKIGNVRGFDWFNQTV